MLSYLFLQEFDQLNDSTDPEILRSNLSSVLLQMLSVGNKDIERYCSAVEGISNVIQMALVGG